MATIAKPAVATNAAIALMLSKPAAPKKSFTDRIIDTVADSGTDIVEFAGRITESVDGAAFDDGVRTQNFRNAKRRTEYWAKFQAEHGLTDAELATVFAS